MKKLIRLLLAKGSIFSVFIAIFIGRTWTEAHTEKLISLFVLVFSTAIISIIVIFMLRNTSKFPTYRKQEKSEESLEDIFDKAKKTGILKIPDSLRDGISNSDSDDWREVKSD